METVNESTTTATETTTTASAPETGGQVSTTPATEQTAAPATGLETLKAVPGKDAAVAEKPVYTPNYKFKVMNKEFEIDEWLRPAVKNQDVEKKIKDLYEKAYGLEAIKPKHESMKEEFDQLKQKSIQTDQALETLGKFVKEGDFDSFFEGLNIPKNKILEYALDLVKREQMSPEQKTQWEASKAAREAARYYEVQNQKLLESQQQFAVQQRTFELDIALQQSEAKVFADAYNAGMGTPEAFKDYCIQIGQAYAARGQDIPASQAVSEAIKHLRAINPSLGAQTQAATPVVQASQKPVIPNIQGRGTSAVKTAVKSLDDLKRRARELQDSNY